MLNPDFETRTGCPDNNDQIKLATFWSGADSTGLRVSCIPDYCHTCATGTTNDINCVPSSILFWQYPHSGKGMAQTLMYQDESDPQIHPYRDYLQGRLYAKLIAGKRYCVSFYVCLEEVSTYAIKEISAYLDNGSIDTTKYCEFPLTRYNPQVSNTAGVITDTMRWTRVEGSFVANGTERFITIGNFKDKAHTTAVRQPHNSYTDNSNTAVSAYLIDDVSVVESDLQADAGPDKHVGKGDSVYIGRPKEAGLECTWSVLGSSAIIGTGTGIWVKPAITTSYVVTQTLCGAVKKDTVRVEVWAVGIHSVNGQSQQYSLSPNPSEGDIRLLQAANDEHPVSIRVYDVVGAIVHSSVKTFSNNAATLNLSSIAPGVYYLVLHDGTGEAYTMKFVKQ